MSGAVSARKAEILEAAVATLRSGREIKVAQLASEIGITAGLIYRYFEDKDELTAAAYERIVSTYVLFDLQTFRAMIGLSREEMREALIAQWTEILGPGRRDARWSRLEALGHFRLNPRLGARIAEMRRRIVDQYVETLREAFELPSATVGLDRVEAMVWLALSVPVGFTAIGGDDAPDDIRGEMVEVLADTILRAVGMLTAKAADPS